MVMVRLVAGVLLALIGVVWILQGLNIMGGSDMSGSMFWAVMGALALAVGIFLARSAGAARR